MLVPAMAPIRSPSCLMTSLFADIGHAALMSTTVIETDGSRWMVNVADRPLAWTTQLCSLARSHNPLHADTITSPARVLAVAGSGAAKVSKRLLDVWSWVRSSGTPRVPCIVTI